MAISATSVPATNTLNQLRTQFNNLVTDVTGIEAGTIEYNELNTTSISSSTFNVKEDGSIIFEGATNDDFETTLTVADPTADRTITLPNETGNVLLDSSSSATFTGTSTSVISSANDSTDETVYVTFVDGQTGSQGIETDSDLTYNPSTNILNANIPADNLSAGDAAINLTTSTGNITIDAQASDSDIIFKGTDGGVDTTFLTIDGSEAGNSTFNGSVTAASFSGDLTGNVTGNADTATALATERAIAVSGAVAGTANFDGTAAIDISTTQQADSVTLGTHTTGNYVATITGGTGIDSTGATTGETINHTLSLDLSELTTSTSDGDGDFFVVVDDANAQKKLTKANIALSGFNNDSGFTTNAGTVTSVELTAGAGIDVSGGPITSSGAITVSIESDLRNDVFQIGRDTNDYYIVNTTTHDWYLDGNLDMRLESDGDLHADGDIVAYSTTTSDERLKTDITVVENALEKVKSIRGVEFTYINDGKRSAGVIAQEVEKVLPQAVREKALPLQMGVEDETEYKVLQYDQLHALLIEAIKELSNEIEELKRGSITK
jgi:hypothetical protein